MRFVLIITTIVLSLLALASASLQLGNLSNDIKTSYSPGEKVEGWINISLTNEDVSGNFSSNFPGGIKLISLLDKNYADYVCSPTTCYNSYQTSNPETSKSFSLASGQEKLISFLLNGNIRDITGFSMNLAVNNSPSCLNPLIIDIFDNRSFYWKSDKISADYTCSIGLGTGCYNASGASTETYIGDTPYCEKIKLPASGKFKLGAWLKKTTSGNPSDSLKMYLYDLDYNLLKSCGLAEPGTAGGEISCNIDYSNEEINEYYICVKADNEAITKYAAKQENSDANACGFFGEPGTQEEYHDYYIFGIGAKFDTIGNVALNKDYNNLLENIKVFVSERYDNNCSQGCSIPLNFISSDADVVASNLSLVYSTSSGIRSSNSIYDASRKEGKLSSGFVKLDLESANITVPGYGNYSLKLYLNNAEILTKTINVQNVPLIKRIYPSVIPAAVATKFTVYVEGAGNITSYAWNFGDNQTATTNVNYVTHSYDEIGGYEMKIKITTAEGFQAEKSFAVIAGSPKDSVNSTINKYKIRLNNLTSQIAGFPSWYKSKIERTLNFSYVSEILKDEERAFLSAQSDDDYVDIMSELNEIELPVSIKESSSLEIPFFVDVETLDPDVFDSLGAGKAGADKEQYKMAIGTWLETNMEMILDYREISSYYENRIEHLIGVFTLRINALDDENELYLFVDDAGAEINGAENKQESGGVGASFSDIPEEINFATQENRPVAEMGIYLSPAFSKLDITNVSKECNFNGICDSGETWKTCRPDCKPWGWVAILLAILVVFAIIVYILLQWWYKYKYESYLFKNRNDIYNIMNFVSNAKSQAITDSEITNSLKKSGWNREQLNYVMKKMKGQAVMPFDFLKLFKKKENMFKQKSA